ncbi:MAG TPA: hypothetical protein VGH73_12575 [Thermoanaerobaculia bacterium]|jgi:hypothetical protein
MSHDERSASQPAASGRPGGNPGGIIGTFWVHFLDADDRSPLVKECQVDISATDLTILTTPPLTLPITESYPQWGYAENDDFCIEYTRSSTYGEGLYGHVVAKPGGPNGNPPVGVWGADTQPPTPGDGNG